MQEHDEGVEIAVEFVKKETAKAFLFTIDGDDVWVPKSQIIDGEPDEGDEDVSVTLTTWFAEKEGLT